MTFSGTKRAASRSGPAKCVVVRLGRHLAGFFVFQCTRNRLHMCAHAIGSATVWRLSSHNLLPNDLAVMIINLLHTSGAREVRPVMVAWRAPVGCLEQGPSARYWRPVRVRDTRTQAARSVCLVASGHSGSGRCVVSFGADVRMGPRTSATSVVLRNGGH